MEKRSEICHPIKVQKGSSEVLEPCSGHISQHSRTSAQAFSGEITRLRFIFTLVVSALKAPQHCLLAQPYPNQTPFTVFFSIIFTLVSVPCPVFFLNSSHSGLYRHTHLSTSVNLWCKMHYNHQNTKHYSICFLPLNLLYLSM